MKQEICFGVTSTFSDKFTQKFALLYTIIFVDAAPLLIPTSLCAERVALLK